MRGIFRFVLRILRPLRARPQLRLVEPAPVESRDVARREPRSTADTRALAVEHLPEAKVVRVLDGDTLDVAKGWSEVRIRLCSVDCPEGDQPWGKTAGYGMIKLVGGRTVRLEEFGLDTHGRTLATVYVRSANGTEWLNVNERMVMLGHAWVMRAYYGHLPKERQAKLNQLEAWARSKKVGLWRTENPIPPWQWRKPKGEGVVDGLRFTCVGASPGADRRTGASETEGVPDPPSPRIP